MDVIEDVPANDRGLDVEHLRAVLDPWSQRLIPASVGRGVERYVTGMDGGHVTHGGGRRVETHDHAARHDAAAHVVRAQRKVDVEPGHDEAGEQHQGRHARDGRQLRARGVCRHLVVFRTLAVLPMPGMGVLEVEPGARRPLRHQPVLQVALDHPDVHRIRDGEARDHAERHDAPEEQLRGDHRAHVAAHHEEAHDGRHAGHHRVHADELWKERLANVVPVTPAHHRLHEERLEDEEAAREAGEVLDDQVDPHRQPQGGGDGSGQDDAGRVAGDAVDRAADALLPQGRRELLVGPRPRLLVGEDVEQEAERPHVERHENETPLHHGRLGVVPALIPAHPHRGDDGDGEPRHQEVVDRLDQHRTPLGGAPGRRR